MPYYWTPYPYPHYYWASYGPYLDQVIRSDAEVRDDIKNRMLYDPWVDSTLVDVTVHRGVVTLTGTVSSLIEKRAAGDDAWDTPGVIDVHNDLVVAS
jgi:osmotically-inducible protein OsmY